MNVLGQFGCKKQKKSGVTEVMLCFVHICMYAWVYFRGEGREKRRGGEGGRVRKKEEIIEVQRGVV